MQFRLAGGWKKSTQRNLIPDEQLGGVIFQCNNKTIDECLQKKIFGVSIEKSAILPDIPQGLPLFLFNLSDGKLHGIYEAAGQGPKNIDPHAWTENKIETTPFPAQVRVNVKAQCFPLSEDQFMVALQDNFHNGKLKWLQLSCKQTEALKSVFKPIPPITREKSGTKHAVVWKEKESNKQPDDFIPDMRNSEGSLHKDANMQEESLLAQNSSSEVNDQNVNVKEKVVLSQESSWNKLQATVNELMQKSEELETRQICPILYSGLDILKSFRVAIKGLKIYSVTEILQLSDGVTELGKQMEGLWSEVQELKTICGYCFDRNLEYNKVIYLVGGFDGSSWLSTVDYFSPARHYLGSIKPMSCPRSYTSAIGIEENILVVGGRDGNCWYDTVECYDQKKKKWIDYPRLRRGRGAHAAVNLRGDIYVIGGGNHNESFYDVEVFLPTPGRWLSSPALTEKRLGTAAVDCDGVIYTTGGYDGEKYLMSAERYDPREGSWISIPDMKVKRSGHSLAIVKEKIYAIGGHDGAQMVSSTEIFDPRKQCWMPGDPMGDCRGYAAAAVFDDTIYLFGGNDAENDICDTVECFKEGEGWRSCFEFKKKTFMSAVAI